MRFMDGSGALGAAPGEGLGARLEKLRVQLGELAKKAGKGTHEVGGDAAVRETITDDAGMPADKAQQMLREETAVREALRLFGVDYDGLIALSGPDGEPSVYARAVAANPGLTREVAAADHPVVAALKVAVGFKPVADFTAKYGDTPEAIRQAVRAEVEAEMQATEPKVAAGRPVFSTMKAGGAVATSGKKLKSGLRDVFGK